MPLYNVVHAVVVLIPPQATHPYFGRVSFSAGARFEAEAAFLKSHYWDKVVGAHTARLSGPCVISDFTYTSTCTSL